MFDVFDIVAVALKLLFLSVVALVFVYLVFPEQYSSVTKAVSDFTGIKQSTIDKTTQVSIGATKGAVDGVHKEISK